MPSRLTCATALLTGGVLALSLAACSSSNSDDGAKKPGTPASGQPPKSGGSASTGDPRVANITITSANGCASDKKSFPAGGITVKVTNKDANAVSEVEWLSGERIVGEKENLPPGFSGTFSVTVGAGSYSLYCPGAATEKRTLTVTGKSNGTSGTAVSALLAQASKGYATYVDTQIDALTAGVAKLNTALDGKNLKAAQKAYIQARPFYEKIEPVAESFVIGKDSIDADIDVRIGDTTFAKWTGFHRIEYGLFKKQSLAGLQTFGTRLVSDVARLKKLTTGLTYKPVELANGAQELLDEVASSKITGEEEAYSGIDLLDFANNDEGAEQAFAQLQPALNKIDPVLTKQISTNFAALDALVNNYRTDANPSGFKLYSQLTAADKRGFAAAVKAVAEPLSQVGSKVANA